VRVSPRQATELAALMAALRAGRLPSAVRWADIARPEQLLPAGDWRTWLILAGRGWGKTRTGAEAISQWVRTGAARHIALVGQTAADVRDVMIQGDSGLLAVARSGERPRYEPSKRRLTWSNGAMAITFSAEDPDSLRGPQFDAAWCDELAAWRHPEAYDQLQYGLRIGLARQVVTTTPRPLAMIRALLDDLSTFVTRGRTLDNAANLSSSALEHLLRRYEGTRLGRQELDAEILLDTPGALWTRAMFDDRRAAPALVRIVVAVDPAVSTGDDSDDTGIVVVGKGIDGCGYVLDDRSGHYTPEEWASVAIGAYHDWKADLIVAEDNNGGEMVEHTLRMNDRSVPVKRVHASRGKRPRAEPVSVLYTAAPSRPRLAFHTRFFPQLEDQLATWTPEDRDSPDRLDAMVWAFTELLVAPAEPALLTMYREELARRQRLAGAERAPPLASQPPRREACTQGVPIPATWCGRLDEGFSD